MKKWSTPDKVRQFKRGNTAKFSCKSEHLLKWSKKPARRNFVLVLVTDAFLNKLKCERHEISQKTKNSSHQHEKSPQRMKENKLNAVNSQKNNHEWKKIESYSGHLMKWKYRKLIFNRNGRFFIKQWKLKLLDLG